MVPLVSYFRDDKLSPLMDIKILKFTSWDIVSHV